MVRAREVVLPWLHVWSTTMMSEPRNMLQQRALQQNLLDGGARGGNSYQNRERIARRALTVLARKAVSNKRIR